LWRVKFPNLHSPEVFQGGQCAKQLSQGRADGIGDVLIAPQADGEWEYERRG
jgi:hypothetical protein